MTKLPQDFGFDTWIQMYKHLMQVSQPSQTKTLVFQQYENPKDYVDGKITTRKITLKTIQANCWKEIKDCLLNENDKHKLMSSIYQSMQVADKEFMKRINRLINAM